MVLKTLISNSQFLPQVARLPVLAKKVFAPVMIDVFYEKHVGGLFFGQLMRMLPSVHQDTFFRIKIGSLCRIHDDQQELHVESIHD